MLEKNSRTLIAVPMFNCGDFTLKEIKAFEQANLPPNSDILIIDNRSEDNSVEIISKAIDKSQLNIKLIQNNQNYHLGGSSKIAFQYGYRNNYDYLLIHHGSGKADINNFIKARDEWGKYDMLLGSRFLKGTKNQNYGFLQYIGNLFYNICFSILLRERLSDLGSSTNFYKLNKQHEEFILRCADGLTFNYYLLIHQISNGLSYKYFSSPLKVTDQKSSLNRTKHLNEMIKILISLTNRKNFLKKDFSRFKLYEYTTIKSNS